jgi:dihydrodiol dehydrogenase / D-xylose 1-dehydrogenase (NADP)
MAKKIGWGILGPGNIARKFAVSLAHVRHAEAVAVGSRDLAKAQAFAREHGIAGAHEGYDSLVADPDVDVIYVATPHAFHKDHTILALEAGKHVLCEKPFAINAAQAEEMVACAREKKLFLMEGMWARFFPLAAKLRELIAAGAIGDVRMVTADWGFRANANPDHRLFNPELGGGALLDIGIYPVSFANMIFGTPERTATLATMNRQTGVDEQEGILFGYKDGGMAVLHAAIRTQTDVRGVIFGTEGRIELDKPFRPAMLTMTRGNETTRIEKPYPDFGFQFEAEAVCECIRAGKTESDVMPLDESLSIMRTMDALRKEWGLSYPADS